MDTLEHIGNDYWELVMRTDPVRATYLGDYRYNDRLADISPDGLSQQRSDLAALADRLRALPPLERDDAVSADILLQLIDNQIAERSHGFEQWNLDQLYGPQVWLQELLNFQPLRAEQDYHDLAARYRAFGPYVNAYIENLRRGVREGRVAPCVARDRVLGQLQDALATPLEKSPLIPKPRLEMERGLREVRRAVEEVVQPSFRSLQEFLGTYPARTHVGVWALPGGEEAYRYRVRMHTTTTLKESEIHLLGLEMLSSLHVEMRKVARRVIGDEDLNSFRNRISTDPANYHPTREALLDGYSRLMRQIESALGRWFLRLPSVGCDVKAIEEFRERDAVAGYYHPPPDDLTRHGVFYANTYRPETRPRCNMAALTAHEAMPGHHLQISLAIERRGLPSYRRHSDFTAFIEGWALYAERLAQEMGIYDDDLSTYGMLTHQAWRAARLVVDTGIHAMKWDRAKAVDFMICNVGLPETEMMNEVDRYVVWPGQALAYSVGMSEILRLRRQAENRLRGRFDIRAFHDAVLCGGAVPLTTLARIVGNHVEAAATMSEV